MGETAAIEQAAQECLSDADVRTSSTRGATALRCSTNDARQLTRLRVVRRVQLHQNYDTGIREPGMAL
jgi:hypothetical protein